MRHLKLGGRPLLPLLVFTILAAALAAAAEPKTKSEALKSEIKDLSQRVEDLQKENTALEEKLLQVEPSAAGRDGPVRRVEEEDVHDWSGFYAGASLGGGMANGVVEDKDCWDCASDSFSEGFRQSGLHAGYNKQFHQAVIGLETEVNLGSQDHTGYLAGSYNGGIYREATKSKIDWTGAVLARAGVAIGEALLFTEAGPAFAHFKGSAVASNAPPPYSYDVDRRVPAVKAAIGVEYMLTRRISVRAQYSVLEMLDQTAPIDQVSCGAGTCRTGFTSTQQAATLGADWHF